MVRRFALQAVRTVPLRHVAGFPCRGLLRELRQHDGHQGQLPCYAILGHSIMPSLVHMLDLKRIGEAAGRSLFPCFPQVDADAMVWLRSLHDPYGRPTCMPIFGCVPTYVSGSIISIPPVKPCRRRRHSSPQMRVNRFVFLNLPILKASGTISA